MRGRAGGEGRRSWEGTKRLLALSVRGGAPSCTGRRYRAVESLHVASMGAGVGVILQGRNCVGAVKGRNGGGETGKEKKIIKGTDDARQRNREKGAKRLLLL